MAEEEDEKGLLAVADEDEDHDDWVTPAGAWEVGSRYEGHLNYFLRLCELPNVDTPCVLSWPLWWPLFCRWQWASLWGRVWVEGLLIMGVITPPPHLHTTGEIPS